MLRAPATPSIMTCEVDLRHTKSSDIIGECLAADVDVAVQCGFTCKNALAHDVFEWKVWLRPVGIRVEGRQREGGIYLSTDSVVTRVDRNFQILFIYSISCLCAFISFLYLRAIHTL
ncbi:uncharacterized protein BDV14DRAFT_132044 [Aspergillus stella-maris]|uniref:uncharacterized protein n=1 Tax=Aspergillus stella-maris TaxID=1810926 RepID=UPI003CCD09A2